VSWSDVRNCLLGFGKRLVDGLCGGSVCFLQSAEKTLILKRKSVIFRCFPAGILWGSVAGMACTNGAVKCFEGVDHGGGCKRA